MSAEGGDPQQLLNRCPECGAVLDVSNVGPFDLVGCPTCGASVRVRTRFDHFEIQRKLGEGGMSIVFEALDTNLDRLVALKILHPEFSRREDLMELFEREARLTAAISHPNIVEVYSVGRDQGYFYIAMEVVRGKSLESIVDAGEKLREARVLEIGQSVAKGLRAAHGRGLIHRDIKPGNILFSESGVAKLVDFGLALMHGHDDDSDEIWATPYYVPPEKLDGDPEDARSDIYSLGATLFHALAGKPPFQADTASIDELREMKARPVSVLDAGVPVTPTTGGVIDRMMRNSPDDRHADYDELIEDLGRAAGMLEGRRDEAAPEKKKNPLVGLRIAAVAGLIVVGAGAFYVINHQSTTDSGNDVIGEESGGDAAADALHARAYLEARETLFGGDVRGAFKNFVTLRETEGVAQPLLNWARFNAGLSGYLAGEARKAGELFKEIAAGGLYSESPSDQELAYFFVWTGHHLARPLPVMPEELVSDGEEPEGLRPIAWLAYGLKNWNHGRFAAAIPFFEAFRDCEPSRQLEWIAKYKPLIEPYFGDFESLRDLPKPRSGMALAELKEVDASLAAVERALQTQGAGRELVADRRRRAGERIAVLEKEAESEMAEAAQREREQAAAKRKAEFEKLDALLASIKPYGPAMKFEEAVAALAAASLEDADAARLLADHRHAWERASRFFDTLLIDLNRIGYTGDIESTSGGTMYGTITLVNEAADLVRVRQSFGETSLPFSSLTLDSLIEIAESIPDRLSSAGEQQDRREILAFFSLRTGRRELAADTAEALSKESEAFAQRWQRLLPGASGTAPESP